MAIATAPTACAGIRATCAACRRRRTRSSAPRDDYKRAVELYQSISPWGNSNRQSGARAASLESVNFRLHQIEQAIRRRLSRSCSTYGGHPQQIG